MNANELAEAMEIRASIRRQATSRKSVTEGANDRLADQLDQAATMLRQQQAEIEALKKFNKAILKKGGYPYPLLTDEEIADLIANKVTDSEMIKQALRKAQE